MQKALLSALTGLRINQQYLDVIGNNLANTSTHGYKGARVTFSELLGQTISPASGPTNATGGRNPSDIGSGAKISSIDRSFSQGSLLSTGRELDLGIQGEGFFVVNDGTNDFYTRVGTFGMDANEYLIDLRSGYRVKNVLGSDIQIQLNTVIPAQETQTVDFQGNLPGVVNGPLAEVLQTDAAFEDHRSAFLAADAAGPYAISPGDALYIEVDGNAAVPYTFTAADIATPGAATANELAIAINANIAGVTAVNNGGTLELTSSSTGTTSTLFVTMDAANVAGAALFASNQGTTIQGTEAIAVGTTDLNDLDSNNTDYVPGDRIRISGTLADGSAVAGEFMYGDPAVNPAYHGTDLASLVARMNTLFQSTDPVNGSTFTLETDGSIRMVANATGDSSFSALLQDVQGGSTGQTNWSTQFFGVNVQGTDPDTANIVTSVFDSQGQQHTVSLDFERQDDGTWTLTPSVDPTEGTVLSAPITGIQFDANGMLQVVPPSQLDIQWTSVPGTQSLNLDLGSAGMTDGLTQFGLGESVIALSDGYTAGSLANIAVRGDGMIEGFYTNGQIQDLDQIGIALFMNSAGLNSAGGTLFSTSSNSGQPMMMAPQAGSAGTIMAGTLEGSNVDIAEEFVRLIEAQRSFQANARMVTTTDEVLAELVNLV